MHEHIKLYNKIFTTFKYFQIFAFYSNFKNLFEVTMCPHTLKSKVYKYLIRHLFKFHNSKKLLENKSYTFVNCLFHEQLDMKD